MPLKNNVVYAIRNDLTHTVLDLSATDVARGWRWHDKHNQKWKLIQVDVDANTWRLRNQGNDHFLSHQNDNRRLHGVADDAALGIFVIRPVPGLSEKYIISYAANGQAVTLATGGPDVEAHSIPLLHQVPDLHADGAPIVLEAPPEAGATQAQRTEAENKKRAQMWSFHRITPLPLADGTYKILNFETGNVLGVSGNALNADGTHTLNIVSIYLQPLAPFRLSLVQGQESLVNNNNQKWIVKNVDPNSDLYTLESCQRSTGGDPRFLGTPNDVPEARTRLTCRAVAHTRHFAIRKVPNTNLYKIFLAPNANNVSPLAVNLDDQEAPQVADLQAVEAQKWSFV